MKELCKYIMISLTIITVLAFSFCTIFCTFKSFNDIKRLNNQVIQIMTYIDSNKVIFAKKVQDLKSINKVNENVNKDMIEDIKKDMQSYYSNITTNTIDRINMDIAILAVIATVFALFGICISFININAFRDIDKKSKMIEDCKKQTDELKAMQYLLLGKLYEMSGNKNRIKYAIEEYKKAKGLPNSQIITTQLIDIYSDLFEKTKDGKFLELCIDCIEEEEKKEKKEENKPILIEWYFTMGCLYGVIAKNLSKIEYDLDKDELLKKSKNSFIKVIHMEDKNYQFYTNLALTSYYLKDKENVIKYLKKAKKCVDEDELLGNQKIDIFKVFDINDMEKIGYEDWVKYKKQVGIEEADIETKDKFEQKIEDEKSKK